MDNLTAINVPIEKSLKNSFKARCAIKGENMTIVVSKLIKGYINEDDRINSEIINA